MNVTITKIDDKYSVEITLSKKEHDCYITEIANAKNAQSEDMVNYRWAMLTRKNIEDTCKKALNTKISLEVDYK